MDERAKPLSAHRHTFDRSLGSLDRKTLNERVSVALNRCQLERGFGGVLVTKGVSSRERVQLPPLRPVCNVYPRDTRTFGLRGH